MPADSAWSRFRAALRRWWRRLIGADLPPPFLKQFREFFGDDFDRLETHEKTFPGYDIVSVVRALRSFGLDYWIRVTIGTPGQNERFVAALASALGIRLPATR